MSPECCSEQQIWFLFSGAELVSEKCLCSLTCWVVMFDFSLKLHSSIFKSLLPTFSPFSCPYLLWSLSLLPSWPELLTLVSFVLSTCSRQAWCAWSRLSLFFWGSLPRVEIVLLFLLECKWPKTEMKRNYSCPRHLLHSLVFLVINPPLGKPTLSPQSLSLRSLGRMGQTFRPHQRYAGDIKQQEREYRLFVSADGSHGRFGADSGSVWTRSLLLFSCLEGQNSQGPTTSRPLSVFSIDKEDDSDTFPSQRRPFNNWYGCAIFWTHNGAFESRMVAAWKHGAMTCWDPNLIHEQLCRELWVIWPSWCSAPLYFGSEVYPRRCTPATRAHFFFFPYLQVPLAQPPAK